MRFCLALCALGIASPSISFAQSATALAGATAPPSSTTSTSPSLAAAAADPAPSPTPSSPPAATAATPAPSPSPTPTLSPEDQQLMEEIEKTQSRGAGAGGTQPGAAPAPAPAAETAPAATGGARSMLSNAYNPAISANGLFLDVAGSSDKPNPAFQEQPTGITIQEIEVQLTSNVDPYFLANLILSSPGGEGIELEEGYLQPFWSPAGLAFRFGKLKESFGRENFIHTHALPFVDKSLVGNAVFTEEGLSEPSAEVSWLSPLPWYSLFTATAMQGDNAAAFNSPRPSDIAGYGAWKNLIDVSDHATLEEQLSYAAGNNSFGKLSQVYGADLVFKWKPAHMATYHSAEAVAETLYAHEPQATGPSRNVGGAYGYLQYQFLKRWFAAARFDYLGFNAREEGITRRESAIVAFAPSEFSAIRLQASATEPPFGEKTFWQGFLQLNFTIGNHPAHSY